MRVIRRAAILSFMVVILAPSGGGAQRRAKRDSVLTHGNPSAPGHGLVDQRFAAIRAVLDGYGPQSRYFGDDSPERTDGTPGLLWFAAPLGPHEVAALRTAGVEFLESAPGRLVRVGNVYGAFVRWSALDVLAAHPRLILAEAAWHPKLERPLEVTGEQIGAVANRRMPDLGYDGTGAVVGDVDWGLDVLHPHFFFADGGAFEWLDIDGDGRFTPGPDVVDYNRNGEADRNEMLRVLDGAQIEADQSVTNRDGVLDPAYDWLYADSNGDGERNLGVDAGFTEFDPGYGEPVFIADDANRNGLLDGEERLLLLSTSKVQRFVTTQRTFIRGVDLIEATTSPVFDNGLHGTGVASILVGGQPPIHQRVGVAPGAEIVAYSSHIDGGPGLGNAAQLRDLQDAIDNGVDVLVHEWTNPYTAPHDGSGSFEAALDAARAAGVIQVMPVGNLNLSKKHREVEVTSGTPVDFRFMVDEGFPAGAENPTPYTAVYLSIFWRGEHLPTFTLESPAGEVAALPLTSVTPFPLGDDIVQASYNRSNRGTHHLLVNIWRDDGESLAVGVWNVRVTDVATDDVMVGRIGEGLSNWSVGVRWEEPTSDHGTIVYPSTADAGIGVAAFGGRAPDAEGVYGALRDYSGRGPRIDGARVVDIAAPDDPYVALIGSPPFLDAGYGRSWFFPFGGTSGAGPHVAGAAVLLRGLHPDWTAEMVETTLFETVRLDEQTPAATELPDESWGFGKLDVFRALRGVVAPEPNSPPVVEGVQNDAGGLLALVTDPDGDSVLVRWDVDYDGEWDTEWTALDPLVAAVEGATVRVEAADGRGGRGGFAVKLVEAMEPTLEPDAGDAGLEEDSGAAGDAGEPRVRGSGCFGCWGAPNRHPEPFLLILGATYAVSRRRKAHGRKRTAIRPRDP